MAEHNITASSRNDEGKGASRRLRRTAQIPAIVYGGSTAPKSIQFEHEKIWIASQNEWFYSSILSLNLDGKVEKVLLRDMQRHPYKQQIMHMDFQRVDENQPIRVAVPLHFLNEDKSPAGKAAEVVVTHELTEVDHQLPAEGPAGIPRGRPGPAGSRHDRPPVGAQAAGRRGDPRVEAGQGARPRRRHRQARQGRSRGSGRSACSRRPGGQGRQEGRREEVSLCRRALSGRAAVACHGWLAPHRWAGQSRTRTRPDPAQRRVPFCGRACRQGRRALRAGEQADGRDRQGRHRRAHAVAVEAGHVHEPQRQVGHRRPALLEDRAGRSAAGTRRAGPAARNGAAQIRRRTRRPERPARHHATVGPWQVPPPADRHRPSRAQGQGHAVGAGQGRAWTTRRRSNAPSTMRSGSCRWRSPATSTKQ